MHDDSKKLHKNQSLFTEKFYLLELLIIITTWQPNL